MYPHLVSSILRSAWMMSPESAEGFAPIVLGIIKGNSVLASNLKVDNYSYVIDSGTGQANHLGENVEQGSIGVVMVQGPTTKYSQECGPIGYVQIEKDILRMENDNNIKAIVFDIDSPGGQASYLDTLYKTISSLETNTIAYVSGQCCSAAYYMASACNEIYANSKQDTIGSIGTMITFMDLRGFYEKEGVKLHEVYADQSKNKNGLFNKALDGNYDELKKQLLNPLSAQFIADVSKKRTIEDKEVFTGHTYNADVAVANGLIDGIQSFDSLILSISQQKTSKQNTSMKQEWKAVNSTLGVEGFETHEGGVFLNEDQMEALNASLESKNTEFPPAVDNAAAEQAAAEQNAKIDALVTRVEAAEGLVKTQGETINSLNTQITELGGKSGAAATTTATAANEFEEGKEVDPWNDPSNPLNKAFDEHLG